MKKVCGMGINDLPRGSTANNGRIHGFYRAWSAMLNRCYSESHRHLHPTYSDCTVCDEWLSLSTFKKWYDSNYVEGCHLDKDILIKGNKIYRPEACRFIPVAINSLLTDSAATRGECPQGAWFDSTKSKTNRYRACITRYGSTIHIGSFPTPELAHEAYMVEKRKYIKELAEKFFSSGEISEDVFNALIKRARRPDVDYTKRKEAFMRNTGKTFRIILNSLLQASEGKDVVVVCNSNQMADWTFKRAADMAFPMLGSEAISRNCIKAGEGQVRFMSMKDKNIDSLPRSVIKIDDIDY